MKLRQPKTPPLAAVRGTATFETAFRVDLITPMYGGGTTAGRVDVEMPIRASAIRGQLRFWWRLLNRHRFTGTEELFCEECSIFGGLSSRGATASRLSIWITDTSQPSIKPCVIYKKNEQGKLTSPQWNGLPGYALFPGQGVPNQAKNDFKEDKHPAELLFPPFAFTLHFAITGDAESAQSIWSQVEPAIRWWASFGGIGARTRRGVGSIKIGGLTPVNNAEAMAAGCRLVRGTSSDDNAQIIWGRAINKLKMFRQGLNVGRNPSAFGKPAGRSRWPEADTIREITGCHLKITGKTHAPVHPAKQSFPRAAFGLPIITHFQEGPINGAPPADRDPDDTSLYPEINHVRKDRMASPLILKAMWTGKDYESIALLLPYSHATHLNVVLQDDSGTAIYNGDAFPPGKQTQMTSGTVTNPLSGKTADVLNEFLNFF